ncbi:RraA family protein [Phenylobacterium immobile]|uniref:RraA family protein n=1 Tax=Phenylobacterium immobile TaxID=21 RepID=UPI000A4F004E|nr:RraA family protein [Phenylobacterium immobile]
MIGSRRHPNAPQAAAEIIEGFKILSTSIISDSLDRMPGAKGLRPFHKGGAMAGTAVTVMTAAGDNAAIHEALSMVRPGDVLVIDAGGDLDRALIGELLSAIAVSRGVAGIVLDGAVRDTAILAGLDMPVFAKGVSLRGPFKNGPGRINVPVSIGGMVVSPGDVVIGDSDGVIAFSQEIAAELLEAANRQEAFEAGILRSILDGSYVGAYALKED